MAVIGNLWPVKRHRVLVEAAALVRDRCPRLKFLCAGEGSEKEWLRQRINALNLRDRVHLIGHRTDVPSILRRSSAFALCSEAEGLSNAVMEAMAARVPIVATSGDSLALLIESSGIGLTVPPGDVDALEDALFRLLDDTALNASCRSAIEHVVPRYQWSTVLEVDRRPRERAANGRARAAICRIGIVFGANEARARVTLSARARDGCAGRGAQSGLARCVLAWTVSALAP